MHWQAYSNMDSGMQIQPLPLSLQTQLGVHHCLLFIYYNSMAQIDERKLSYMQ